MNDVIQVCNLRKDFRVAKVKKGAFGQFKHLLFPQYESLNAVEDISFTIQPGEKVAFMGPNGAGKSTTIKMLAGIYQPSGGSIRIFGKDPFLYRKEISYRISTVFGQRSQLWYHLSAYHSFKLLATIYDIPHKQWQERLEHLVEIFQLSRFISRPIRELSLGERMRCELVASLLHSPQILFLDEPTIGLDIVSKDAIRNLIQQRAKLESTVIFLTSHDITDIEKVCNRLILVNRGKVIIDDSVKAIKQRYFNKKLITVKSESTFDWKPREAISLIKQEHGLHKFEIDLNLIQAQEAIEFFVRTYRFTDIVVEDPPLEEVIKEAYLS